MSQKLEEILNEIRYAGINTAKDITTTGAMNSATIVTTGAASLASASVTGAFTAGTFAGKSPVISGSGATVGLTAAQSGSLVLFDRAAGIVFTLPAPVVGLTYTFLVTTSVTSNAAKVITDAASTYLMGSLTTIKTDLTTLLNIADGTSIRAYSANGTTTGGLLGTILYLYCVTATQWLVDGSNLGSGTIATPFATS